MLYRTALDAVDDITRYAFADTPTPYEERIHWLPYVFDWAQIVELSAIEPWPALRIEWRHRRVVDHRVFEPRRTWFKTEPNRWEQAWDAVIVELFERIEALGLPVSMNRGWAGAEHVPWIDDEHWPSDRDEGQGGYRVDAKRRVLATRSKPAPGEFLLSWFGAGPRQPWRATPREVVVTRDHVHARMAGDRTARLPLSALRLRRGGKTDTGVYVFGRRTLLVLPFREGCEVRALLDGHLGTNR